MKITISLAASEALKGTIERFKQDHDYRGRNASRVVSQIVEDFNSFSNAEANSRVVEALLSPEDKKRAVIRKMLEYADGMDTEALRRKVIRMGRQRSQDEPESGDAGGHPHGEVKVAHPPKA